MFTVYTAYICLPETLLCDLYRITKICSKDRSFLFCAPCAMPVRAVFFFILLLIDGGTIQAQEGRYFNPMFAYANVRQAVILSREVDLRESGQSVWQARDRFGLDIGNSL